MKIIKFIFENPYIIMLFSLLTFFIPKTLYLGRWIFIFICPIFLISLVYSLVQRKWINLLLSFFVYLILFISFIFWGIINSNPEELGLIKQGNNEFYLDEIYRSTKLQIPKSLVLISKNDTIYFGGPGGSDYSAECLYTGPKKDIQKLEKLIQENNDFERVQELEIYPTNVISAKNFKRENIKSVYTKKMDNLMIVYMAFDKNYAKLYYSVLYY